MRTELHLYERLRDMACDFVLLKEEIANAGFKIKAVGEGNLPRSYSWLESDDGYAIAHADFTGERF